MYLSGVIQRQANELILSSLEATHFYYFWSFLPTYSEIIRKIFLKVIILEWRPQLTPGHKYVLGTEKKSNTLKGEGYGEVSCFGGCWFGMH